MYYLRLGAPVEKSILFIKRINLSFPPSGGGGGKTAAAAATAAVSAEVEAVMAISGHPGQIL